jgi:ATP-dependent DNA helicase RecG
MFIKARIEEGNIVKIEIQEGTNKPYYLKDKGLKPSGVYVRQGASSVQASYEAIRQMIKLTDGDSFENMRSLHQELTFNDAKKEFQQQQLTLEKSQMKTLGMVDSNQLFTNLALLLSDQCEHSIKVAVFSGNEKGEFKTRREFVGSLFAQLSNCYDFLDLNNNLHAHFEGLSRIEKYDYPQVAIREALLNAVIHRDYSLSGSIIVNIYDNKMEIISLGGLMPKINYEDIFVGISQPRNEKLANIFYRLKFIESYGTGITKMMNAYIDEPIKPSIHVTPGAFVTTLPNQNYDHQPNFTIQERNELKPQHAKILKFLDTHEV